MRKTPDPGSSDELEKDCATKHKRSYEQVDRSQYLLQSSLNRSTQGRPPFPWDIERRPTRSNSALNYLTIGGFDNAHLVPGLRNLTST